MNFVKNLKSYIWGSDANTDSQETSSSMPEFNSGRSGGGFKRSIPAPNQPKASENKPPALPILQELPNGTNGGIQGLSWYASMQRVDEDGCVADLFFVELGGKLMQQQVRTRPKPGPVEVLIVDSGNVVLSH
ncbi:hypothetical protein CEUSTIGMA_g12832.t1 [Chlamydomonas eustigma]|uniref:Uncharacterized protein n=1 Tax=Chlamydomonas eustigma TaxID=1157962 RepID=A0A250XQT9_9CHLO|nr:hypothetical protein CEUSTIGMA_g12832.t1 [Chlamydomonas eustigma]|eukprot:GAX85416.1 hypothetical protein CEUSTIGMA_g12832.t1 [Chlamydomonas eustigma]